MQSVCFKPWRGADSKQTICFGLRFQAGKGRIRKAMMGPVGLKIRLELFAAALMVIPIDALFPIFNAKTYQ